MAAVTKNLGFIVTTSTSYEAPFVIAKRFSTLDHLTKGRFGWNIVTSFKESAAKAVSTHFNTTQVLPTNIHVRLVCYTSSMMSGTQLRVSMLSFFTSKLKRS